MLKDNTLARREIAITRPATRCCRLPTVLSMKDVRQNEQPIENIFLLCPPSPLFVPAGDSYEGKSIIRQVDGHRNAVADAERAKKVEGFSLERRQPCCMLYFLPI